MSGLDPSQHRAVHSNSSRILVVAGPGSGKTRVLSFRFARLIKDGIDPSRILAVTFTNRAAREMKERIADLEGAGPRGLNIGTFHSISLKILKKHDPNLRLIGREEAEGILKRLGAKDPSRAASMISAFKNNVLEQGELDPVLLDSFTQELQSIGALDLDDLVPRAAALVLDAGLRPFQHMMIDEYQDINPVQADFVKALERDAEGLLAIGDPDQAIYSFRGSTVDCFLDFERVFPGTERIDLSRNYRSGRTIVEASSSVISNNSQRLDGLAQPVKGGGAIEVREFNDEREEAAFIVKEMERLMGGLCSLTASDDTGMRFSDLAVLVRTNQQAEYIAGEFERSTIPVHLVARPGADLNAFIERLRGLEPSSEMPLAEFVKEEALKSGLKGPSFELALSSVSQYGTAQAKGFLAQFLDELMLSGAPDNMDIKADKVNIMTLHAAKGLEWKCVFIAGAEDGLIPMRMIDTDIEEERRLFYVGFTRAKERLFITHAKMRRFRGEAAERKRSPFIDEIPEALAAFRAAERKKARKPVQKQLF